MRDLDIRNDRFDITKECLGRSDSNWEFQQPFAQAGDCTNWLTSEHDHVVEELVAELPDITDEAVSHFGKELLSQMHMEVYVHGDIYKEDAIELTDIMLST